MVKTWVWIAIVASLAVIGVVVTVLLWVVPPSAGTIAKVYVDGQCVYTVDLGQVDQPYEYLVETPYGTNVLLIERGRVCVRDADCKGKDCVRLGWLAQSGKPLVCTPHHLVVQIEGALDDNTVIQ